MASCEDSPPCCGCCDPRKAPELVAKIEETLVDLEGADGVAGFFSDILAEIRVDDMMCEGYDEH